MGLPTDAPIRDLTTESAERRAIVLLPKALDATQDVEFVVFLHGFTEDASIRPFAGWRAYKPPPSKGAPAKKAKAETATERWRHGIDPTDVAPVRDVALDQAEQQLEDSGQKQVLIVLVQGGLTSQFGDKGDKNFDAGDYVAKIASRLLSEHCWLDGKGNPVTDHPPNVTRIVMAGHSGAGATLANMTNEAVRGILPAGDKRMPKAVPSSPLTGDLVIFDAINGSQLGAFQLWVQTVQETCRQARAVRRLSARELHAHAHRRATRGADVRHRIRHDANRRDPRGVEVPSPAAAEVRRRLPEDAGRARGRGAQAQGGGAAAQARGTKESLQAPCGSRLRRLTIGLSLLR